MDQNITLTFVEIITVFHVFKTVVIDWNFKNLIEREIKSS